MHITLAIPVQDLPVDYEVCGECHYDHSYEPEEAHRAHQLRIVLEEGLLTNDV